MLLESQHVRQNPGEPLRRWFASSYFDLIVWYNAEQVPVGFQLCYDKGRSERAMTWRRPDTYSHMSVDDGEARPFRYKAAPSMMEDEHFEPTEVAALFEKESGQLPPDLAVLVLEGIRRFPTR